MDIPSSTFSEFDSQFGTNSNGLSSPTPYKKIKNSASKSSKVPNEIPGPPSPTPIASRDNAPRHSMKQQSVFNYKQHHQEKALLQKRISNPQQQRNRASSMRHSAPSVRTGIPKRPSSAKVYRPSTAPAGGLRSSRAKTSDYVYNFRKPGAVFGGTPRACNKALKQSTPPVGLYEPKIMGKKAVVHKIPQSKRFRDKRKQAPPSLFMPKSTFKSNGRTWGKAKRFRSYKDSKPGPGQYKVAHSLNHDRLPYSVFTARRK